MRLMRGIVLCDANFDDMRPDLLALAAFAEATLSATTLRFRKRLD